MNAQPIVPVLAYHGTRFQFSDRVRTSNRRVIVTRWLDGVPITHFIFESGRWIPYLIGHEFNK